MAASRRKRRATQSLRRAGGPITRVLVGLGWDLSTDGGGDFDVDLSCFLLGANGKTRGESDLVFYGQLRSSDGGVIHRGDERRGSTCGDSEQVFIDTTALSHDISSVALVVTIHKGRGPEHDFGNIPNCRVRMVNILTRVEVIRFDLCRDFAGETAIIFGELRKVRGLWDFHPSGATFSGGLKGLCDHFGIDAC